MEPVGFFGIFEESRRIITAHSRHFLGLSVLFLLPIAFLTCAASTFRNWINIKEGHEELLRSIASTYSNHGDDDDNQDFFLAYTGGLMETKVVLLLSLYSLLMFGLALCSNAAVTHSTCNGFYGRGVKLPGAIKSIPGSAWRLLVTTACGMAVLVGISFTFVLFLSLVLLGLSAFNVTLELMAPVHLVIVVLAGLVGLYLQIHWILATVIPVVEGSWGLEPLRRSSYLVQGMRWVSLSLNLFFAITGLALALWASYLQSSSSDSLNMLSKIVQSITVLASMTVWYLYNITTTTVFYMFCKSNHNELLDAIIEEFSRDYMVLPFEYQKVPQLVSVSEVV